jgi:outer membrane protein assembly factor BamB
MNLYVAGKGKVVALDPQSGRELWRAELPKSDFRTLVVEHGDLVFASSYGNVYGLDAKTGRILWQNGLPGLGYGDVTMAIGGRQSTALPPPKS